MSRSRKKLKKQNKAFRAYAKYMDEQLDMADTQNTFLYNRLGKAWNRLFEYAAEVSKLKRERDGFAQLAAARDGTIKRLQAKYDRRTLEMMAYRTDADALRQQLNDIAEDDDK